MYVTVHSRPASQTFLYCDGTNLDEVVALITAAGFVVTSRTETEVVFETYQTMTVSAGNYVSAQATEWGPQAQVHTTAQMNQLFFPASTLPLVSE